MSKDLSQLSEDELKKMVFGTTATAPGQYDTWEEIIEKECRRATSKYAGDLLIVCDHCHVHVVLSKKLIGNAMQMDDVLKSFGDATLLVRFEDNCICCRGGRKGKFTITRIEQ